MDRRAAGLFACLFFAADGCSGAEPAQAADRIARQRAISVRLAEVMHGPIARRVHASGTLHEKAEADLSFKVGGVVARVSADVGSRVKRGQELAVIDVTEARAANAQANQSVDKTARDLERVQRLLASGAVGQVDAQNAETALAVARASAEAAEFNLRHTRILAPDDGVIDRRSVEVGEVVAPGRPVFHMSCSSRGLIVKTELSDRQVLQIQRGDRADVRLDARPSAPLAARVSQIASSASLGAGTFAVELRLDPTPSDLPSGLTAKIEIDGAASAMTSVPIGALVDGEGDSAAVFAVVGDRAKRLPVRVGFFRDDRVALASGLEQIDSVVELGASQLSDGSLVSVIP